MSVQDAENEGRWGGSAIIEHLYHPLEGSRNTAEERERELKKQKTGRTMESSSGHDITI